MLLLTQEHCSLCERASRVLERLAADYPLQVTTLELASKQGRALAERGGILFAPGVFLDGERFSYGRLSERKLRRELHRRRSARTG